MSTDQNWTTIINSENDGKGVHLDLKEFWAYRDLIFLFVKRDFASVYKQTLLGPIWLVLQPLITTFIYVFVFGNIANLGTDGLPRPIFYLSGIIAGSFFLETFTKTSSIFIVNSYIFSKVYFPRLILVMSSLFVALIKFCIQLCLLILLMVYFSYRSQFHFSLHSHYLLFPFIVFLIGILGLGLGMLVSSITIKYRDINNLIMFGIQMLMYATPVVYSMSSIPVKLRQIVAINPMSHLIESFRLSILGVGDVNWIYFLLTSLLVMVLFFLGLVAFKRSETDFIDSI